MRLDMPNSSTLTKVYPIFIVYVENTCVKRTTVFLCYVKQNSSSIRYMNVKQTQSQIVVQMRNHIFNNGITHPT